MENKTWTPEPEPVIGPAEVRAAAELLKNGSTHVKDLYSSKTGRYFEADLLMKGEDGKIVFSLSFPKNNKKSKKK